MLSVEGRNHCKQWPTTTTPIISSSQEDKHEVPRSPPSSHLVISTRLDSSFQKRHASVRFVLPRLGSNARDTSRLSLTQRRRSSQHHQHHHRVPLSRLALDKTLVSSRVMTVFISESSGLSDRAVGDGTGSNRIALLNHIMISRDHECHDLKDGPSPDT